jgi:hypothetical protein
MKFIILARPYNPQSQGCVLLHKLAHTLNKIGHQAAVLFFNGHGNQTEAYFTVDRKFYCSDFIYKNPTDLNAWRKFKENAVIIYPEIISGNPLQGDYVVRYMLNREGFIKKGVMIHPSINDFILTHSYHYHQSPDFHLFNYQGNDLFNTTKTMNFYDRKIDLTYIGKGSKYTKCFKLNGTTEVTREWPDNKLELANLFKASRFIYTWDCITATVTDAILCGTFPVFMTYAPLTKNEVYNLIDLGVSIPEVSYEESLIPLSQIKINAINNFINEMSNKIYQSDLNWGKNVDIFSQKVFSHFKL